FWATIRHGPNMPLLLPFLMPFSFVLILSHCRHLGISLWWVVTLLCRSRRPLFLWLGWPGVKLLLQAGTFLLKVSSHPALEARIFCRFLFERDTQSYRSHLLWLEFLRFLYPVRWSPK